MAESEDISAALRVSRKILGLRELEIKLAERKSSDDLGDFLNYAASEVGSKYLAKVADDILAKDGAKIAGQPEEAYLIAVKKRYDDRTTPKPRDERLDRKVIETDWPIRIKNALRNDGKDYVGEVVNMQPKELLSRRFPGFGKGSLGQLTAELKKMDNLSLDMGIDYTRPTDTL